MEGRPPGSDYLDPGSLAEVSGLIPGSSLSIGMEWVTGLRSTSLLMVPPVRFVPARLKAPRKRSEPLAIPIHIFLVVER